MYHYRFLARTVRKHQQPFVEKTSQAFSGEQLLFGDFERMRFNRFGTKYRSIEVLALCLNEKKKEWTNFWLIETAALTCRPSANMQCVT